MDAEVLWPYLGILDIALSLESGLQLNNRKQTLFQPLQWEALGVKAAQIEQKDLLIIIKNLCYFSTVLLQLLALDFTERLHFRLILNRIWVFLY